MNRSLYDACSFQKALEDNDSVFSHSMDVSRFVHTDPCIHTVGVVGGSTSSVMGPVPVPSTVATARESMVTLENDLRGQTRPVTRCPRYAYSPSERYIRSEELHKPVEHPVIDKAAMSDLKACTMVSFAPTPPRPPR